MPRDLDRVLARRTAVKLLEHSRELEVDLRRARLRVSRRAAPPSRDRVRSGISAVRRPRARAPRPASMAAAVFAEIAPLTALIVIRPKSWPQNAATVRMRRHSASRASSRWTIGVRSAAIDSGGHGDRLAVLAHHHGQQVWVSRGGVAKRPRDRLGRASARDPRDELPRRAQAQTSDPDRAVAALLLESAQRHVEARTGLRGLRGREDQERYAIGSVHVGDVDRQAEEQVECRRARVVQILESRSASGANARAARRRARSHRRVPTVRGGCPRTRSGRCAVRRGSDREAGGTRPRPRRVVRSRSRPAGVDRGRPRRTGGRVRAHPDGSFPVRSRSRRWPDREVALRRVGSCPRRLHPRSRSRWVGRARRPRRSESAREAPARGRRSATTRRSRLRARQPSTCRPPIAFAGRGRSGPLR